MTRVLVNGEERLLTGTCDLASLVASVVAAPVPAEALASASATAACSGGGEGDSRAQATGVAAAVNDRVVPRSRWAGVVLQEHDRVEIVSAVQGG